MASRRKIYIVDSTLRDGEQTGGVVFSRDEKIAIAQKLSEAGVDQIEAGIPAMGGEEWKAVRDICKLNLPASILTWNRARTSDIDRSLSCSPDATIISTSSSDIHIEKKLKKSRKWVLNQIFRTVDYAKSDGVYVVLSAEDASRADPEFLLDFFQAGQEAGANRLRYCDTVGVCHPLKLYREIQHLRKKLKLPIEVHMHNDFGLATANTLMAIEGGATFVNTTVNGLGERAGNSALEEVVMARGITLGQEVTIDPRKLRELSIMVAKFSGRPLWPSKPIFGSGLFIHEASLHISGLTSTPETYEAFSPELVGGERQLFVGKHCGSASILAKFAEYGTQLSDKEAKHLIPLVRQKAIEKKRALFDKELMEIYLKEFGTKE